jgi:cytoskeleton protein RodZ
VQAESDNPSADSAFAEPPPRTLGQELAAERERQGLSRGEVAQRLHMSQWQVEALEGGDYVRLPKGTFLRGFVRNYAKVLGLDGDAMLARLAEAAPLGPAPGIVVPSQNIRFDPIGERLANPYVKAGSLAVVFIALGFAVMYWWLFIRPSPPATMAKKEATVAVPQNIAAAPVPAPEAPAPSPAPSEPIRNNEPVVQEPPKKVEPKKAEPPPKAPPPAPAATVQQSIQPVAQNKSPNERTVKLRFKGEAWVEIKDRSGKVLLSRLNPKGTEAEVSGRPPFAIVIGNAPDVTMLYEDREFPLEPHTRVAVARFTVE